MPVLIVVVHVCCDVCMTSAYRGGGMGRPARRITDEGTIFLMFTRGRER